MAHQVRVLVTKVMTLVFLGEPQDTEGETQFLRDVSDSHVCTEHVHAHTYMLSSK